jgi:hypothetical protein
MDRTQILSTMVELKLFGMKAAYDEIVTTAVKRNHDPQRVVAALLTAEIAEKQARSIRYQMGVAKLPLAKDIDDFAFDGTPINENLVRDLAGGGFVTQQRNAVLIGGTGTGKTHLAIAIARACIRAGMRGRYFNVVDLVNKLEAETRAGRQGRMADWLCRLDFIVLDELGYLPFAQSGLGVRRRQDDHGAARSPHPPLRHRRDRQRKLALQTPGLRSPPSPVSCLRSGYALPPSKHRRHTQNNRLAEWQAATFKTKKGGQSSTPIRGQDCSPIDTHPYP